MSISKGLYDIRYKFCVVKNKVLSPFTDKYLNSSILKMSTRRCVMELVAERTDMVIFFKYHIHKVCDEAKLDIKEKFLQIEYLSKMLAKFVEPNKHFNDAGELVRIVDVLQEEVDKADYSLDSYKRAADKILYYQSFYPEAFKRRLMTINFYSKAATMFYGIVGKCGVPACTLIAMEYSLWNFVLKSTRQRYFF